MRVGSLRRPFYALLFASYFCVHVLQAQRPAVPRPAVPTPITTPDVGDALRTARDVASDYMFPEFVVEGDKPFDQKAMYTRSLVFKPGGHLILTGSFSDRGDRYIIAKTITVLPGSEPATITWQRDYNQSQPPPPPIGKSPSGYSRGSEGAPGGNGAPGQTGNPGYPGRNAPTLYIFTGKVEGGLLLIDLTGERGGPGGQGQPGGDGGFGRPGHPGISSLISCASGGQDGGPGGDGANGGIGGTGGRGGIGGIIVIGTRPNTLDLLGKFLQVDVSGGKGGSGGEGGPGGSGGEGGPGGSGSAFCSGGKVGGAGQNGHSGHDGEIGPDGLPGTYAILPLKDEQLNGLGILK
jgi:hypothetical protein